jgi:pimeloyl-ACP methyl ester carboxylesterase
MIVQAYQNIWEGLVPEGFVVALPINEGGLLPSHSSFGADLSFVIASLRAENLNPASTLYGKLGAKAAVMGHSMGGGASFLSADADPSIDALAVLAATHAPCGSVTASSPSTRIRPSSGRINV